MATSETNAWDGPIRPRLRAETSALHRMLEERLDLLGAGLGPPRYVHVLGAFLGYYDPVEARVAAFARVYPPGLPPPAWSSRLAADLRALGLCVDAVRALPRCRALPRLERPEHLAGCLYVLEGAALGGGVIARDVERHLGFRAGSGAAFFTGEGAATGARWTRFVEWLEALAVSSGGREEIVASARDTFRTFGDWLERRGALR